MIVERAAGEDFEFAVPTVGALIGPCDPYFGGTPQVGAWPESGLTESNACALVSADIGASKLEVDRVLNSQSCIGEKITNFRSLLKLGNPMPSLTTSGNLLVQGSNYISIVPFANNISYAASNSIYYAPLHHSDLLGRLANCFCYSRGGVRIQALLPNVTESNAIYPAMTSLSHIFSMGTTGQPVTMISVDLATPRYGSSSALPIAGAPIVFDQIYQNKAIDVQVPQYSRYPMRSNMSLLTAGLGTAGLRYSCFGLLDTAPPLHLLSVVKTALVITPDTSGILFSRQASDDFNLGLFMSVPPMIPATGGQVI